MLCLSGFDLYSRWVPLFYFTFIFLFINYFYLFILLFTERLEKSSLQS